MNTKRRVKLPRVPGEIAKLTGGPAPTYRQVYIAVLNGAVQAEQGGNGRYEVHEEHLPAIAEHFGLAPRVAA